MRAGICSLYREIHYIKVCYIEVWVYCDVCSTILQSTFMCSNLSTCKNSIKNCILHWMQNFLDTAKDRKPSAAFWYFLKWSVCHKSWMNHELLKLEFFSYSQKIYKFPIRTSRQIRCIFLHFVSWKFPILWVLKWHRFKYIVWFY